VVVAVVVALVTSRVPVVVEQVVIFMIHLHI
jgi:hypothetical protein